MRPDGRLVLLGRKDFQVKVRGHRVELAEVELAVASLDNVKDAVVVAKADPTGEHHLIAYVVPCTEPYSVKGWCAGLAELLPGHMIPAAFHVLPELPRTANGKIDRRALSGPAPPQARGNDTVRRAPHADRGTCRRHLDRGIGQGFDRHPRQLL